MVHMSHHDDDIARRYHAIYGSDETARLYRAIYGSMKSDEVKGHEALAAGVAYGILQPGEQYRCEGCGVVVPAHTVDEVDNVWCTPCMYVDVCPVCDEDYEDGHQAGCLMA